MINHLWQSTLFAIAAGLLTLAFRKNRAPVRFWLWFSASAKFLVPCAVLMSLGSLLPAPTAKRLAPPSVSVAVEQIAEPFSQTPSTPTQNSRDWRPAALLGVWASGFLTVVAIRFRSWRTLRGAPLREPGVVGLWRPKLILPAGIQQRLTPAQLEAVVAHEFCHIERRDNLLAAVHMLVEALFWFHPLVWWIGARLLEERELACDEEVLRRGCDPDVYAEAILNVCKLYAESPLACVSGVTGADLKKRIEAIVMNRIALPLSLARKAALAAAAAVALSAPLAVGILKLPPLRAQATPRFEVASVKPCKLEDFVQPAGPGGRKGGGDRSSSPGRLSTGCDTVLDLISSAYLKGRDPSNPRIVDGPDWIRSERYVVDARAADGQSMEVMRGPMMQSLLADRFKLKIQREIREVPVYFLVAAKDGPKLTPFQPGTCTPVEFGTVPVPRPQDLCFDGVPTKGALRAVEADGISVTGLSKLLFLVMDRPIIDRTGIQGLYDFHLQFGLTENTPFLEPKSDGTVPAMAPPEDPGGPSIFAALQRQYGLRLEPGKGPRDFLVIGHVERPSEN